MDFKGALNDVFICLEHALSGHAEKVCGANIVEDTVIFERGYDGVVYCYMDTTPSVILFRSDGITTSHGLELIMEYVEVISDIFPTVITLDEDDDGIPITNRQTMILRYGVGALRGLEIVLSYTTNFDDGEYCNISHTFKHDCDNRSVAVETSVWGYVCGRYYHRGGIDYEGWRRCPDV